MVGKAAQQSVLDKVSPDAGFLRLPEILKLFPVSKSSWWAGVRNGKWPRSYKLGDNTTAWKISDIRELLDSVDSQAATASKSEGQK